MRVCCRADGGHDVTRVLIVPNYSRADAVEDAHKLEGFLCEKSVDVSLAPDRAARVDDVSAFDLVVSLGGDGTLLRAARIVTGADVPLLGVSYGHLGFLTCAEPKDLLTVVEDALEGRLHESRRSTLDVNAEFIDADGVAFCAHKVALNDLALGHGIRGDMISFEVSVSGNHIDKLRGDGFVVSTATGSTGYALSAGGPIVTPEFEGMVCVPVAPHTIMARAFLTGRDDEVRIKVDPERPAETCVFADGQPLGAGCRLTRVSCRRGKHDLILLNKSRESFYDSVSRVFYGKVAER